MFSILMDHAYSVNSIQALPPLAGSPIEFVRETLKYKSRVGENEHTGEIFYMISHFSCL